MIPRIVSPPPWRGYPAAPLMVSVILGGAYSVHDGHPVRGLPLILCALAVLAAHRGVGAVMLLLDPGGSLRTPQGDAEQRTWTAMGGCVAAFVLGLAAARLSSPLVFLAGVVGSAAAISLVVPPVPLAYLGRGIGEILVVAATGPVPVVAAYASQGGSLHAGVLMASLPAGLLGLGIVTVAHRALVGDDAPRGRLTAGVIAGPGGAARIPWAVFAAAFLAIVANVLLGEYPTWALSATVTAPAVAFLLARRGADASHGGADQDCRLCGILAAFTLAIVAVALATAHE